MPLQTHTHTKRWEVVRRFDSKSSDLMSFLHSCEPMIWFVTEVESGKLKISEATGFRLQSAAGNGASSDSEEDQGEPMEHLIIFYSFGREIPKWDLTPSWTPDGQLVYGVRRTLQALRQQPGSQTCRMRGRAARPGTGRSVASQKHSETTSWVCPEIWDVTDSIFFWQPFIPIH